MSENTPQKLDFEALVAALREMGGFTDEEIERILDLAKKGASVAELMGVPKESLESGYGMGCALFEARQYEEAEVLFRTLCLYDGNSARNWIGLGLCYEKRNELLLAARSFAHAADLQKNEFPKAIYLVAMCCHKMQDVEAAKLLAEKALATKAADAESKTYRNLAKEYLASV